MQQSIHDTNMSLIDTCTILIEMLYIGRNGVLLEGIHYLEPQQTPFVSP